MGSTVSATMRQKWNALQVSAPSWIFEIKCTQCFRIVEVRGRSFVQISSGERRMNRNAGAPDRLSRYRWVAIGAWFFSSVSGFMVLNTIGILLPSISSELQIQPGQQGILVSSAFWGNLVLAIPLIWWISRYRPKILTMVALGLGTLLLFLQASAPAFVALLLARLGFGLTILALEPARALLIHQWFPKREIVLVNGIGNALYGLVVGGGLAATPFILGAMGDDWRVMLRIFATYFAVLTVLWTVLGRERVTTV